MTSLVKNLENITITQKMFDNLDYDAETKEKTITSAIGNKPLGLFVFNHSDLNAASYHLAQSLQNPLNAGAIKCIFVQESCVEKFTQKLKSQLNSLFKEPLASTTLAKALVKSSEIISKLNAKTLGPNVKDVSLPLIVYDFPQEHFTVDGPSPVATLYTFRTVKEAIALSKKENVLRGASIWCENHAAGYEIIAGTSLTDYYLNCCNVEWNPISEYIAKKQTFVLIKDSYHYETLAASDSQKNIVFPFGTTFAN